MEMMVEAQGKVHHVFGFRNHFGAAAKAGEKVADVAVILLNGEGEVLTSRQLCGWNQAMVAGPIVSDELFALETDAVEQPLAGGVITATQHPGQGSPRSGSYARQTQRLAVFFEKVPHLVQCQHHGFPGYFGDWKFLRLSAHPL